MRRCMHPLVLAILSFYASGTYGSTPLFTHSSHLFDSEPASASAVADFDNDEHLDYLIVSSGSQDVPGSGRIEVHRGDGSGGFARLPFAYVHNDVSEVSVADFDRDGNLDFVAQFWGLQGFRVFLGDGLGGFDGGTQHAVGSWLSLLGAGDVDSDAIPDVVVRADGGMSDSLQVYRGVPMGGFAPGKRLAGNNIYGMTLADWNEDGLTDLAVAQVTKSALIYCGLGEGEFAAPVSLITNYYYGSAVSAPDLDRDGHFDLVVSAADWHHNRGGISILFGTGHGSFGRPVFLDEDAPRVALGDLDYDGLDDLVYMREHSEIGVRRQHAPRVFAPEYRVACGVEAERVFLLDVDGDKDLDALCSDYWNPLSAIVPGNGDGTFGGFSAVDAAFSPSYLVAADLNGDDRMDLAASGFNTISILHGDGPFGFRPRIDVSIPTPINWLYARIHAVDLDLDGDLELLALKSDGVVSVANAGSAGYFYAVGYSTSATIRDFAIGDLNDDSYPDLATANQSSAPGLPAIYLASGNGTMSFLFAGLVPMAAGEEPEGVMLRDLDRDGRDDLVIRFSDGVQVRRRSFAYEFAPPQNYGVPPWLRSLVIEDLNNDGYPDIAASGSATVLLRGNGDASFDMVGSIPISVDKLMAADFDLDGDVDLAAQQTSMEPLCALLQDENGVFGPPLRYGTGGAYLNCMASADMDGDAKLDIVCGHQNEPFLTLLSNLSSTPVDIAEFRGRESGGVQLRGARELADGSLRVRFELHSPAAQARLAVYDVRGRLVQTLMNRAQRAGMHQLDWDRRGIAGTRTPRGVYFMELRADATRKARRVVLVRP